MQEVVDESQTIKVKVIDLKRGVDSCLKFTNVITARDDFDDSVIRGLKHMLMNVVLYFQIL